MIVFSTILSIVCGVFQNSIQNRICKESVTTDTLMNFFTMITYGVSCLLFGIALWGEKISLYTIALGIIFGIVNALCNFYKMKGLSEGPMHITMLIIVSSMIIPALSGVFFGEKFSFSKLCIALIFIVFLYFSLNKKGEMKISKKWLVYCLLAFLFGGSIGVIQKIHQMSLHKNEMNVFLFVAFFFGCLFSRLRIEGKLKNVRMKRKDMFWGCVCGLCTYLVNVLSLKLTGLVPSQLIFPILNGGTIILNSVVSIVVFHERLEKKQMVGLIGGMCSLILLCLIP